MKIKTFGWVLFSPSLITRRAQIEQWKELQDMAKCDTLTARRSHPGILCTFAGALPNKQQATINSIKPLESDGEGRMQKHNRVHVVMGHDKDV